MSLRIKTFFLALLLLPAAGTVARAEIKAGDPFPVLADAGLTGMLPATAGKVVLVDFWASYCVPCRVSFPAMAKLHAEYAARGLVIVAVSVDENEKGYADFVKKFAPPFAVVLDRQHTLAEKIDVPAMPTSYLIDRNGKVRFVHDSYHGEETDRQIRRDLDILLAEKASLP